MAQNDIIQSNTKEHLIKTTKSPHTESSLHALNHDKLNTLTIDDKISKETFPDFYNNFTEMATGAIQLSEQISVFGKQAKLLDLMGDQSGQSKQIEKVVQVLTQSRDKVIEQSEQLAQTLKGAQFFNTVELEDIVLMNGKGLSQLDEKEFAQEQLQLYKAAHGDDPNLPTEEELVESSKQQQENSDANEQPEEMEVEQ